MDYVNGVSIMKVYSETSPSHVRAALVKSCSVYDELMNFRPKSSWAYCYPRLLGRLAKSRFPQRRDAATAARSKFGKRAVVVSGSRYWGIYEY